MSPASLDNAMSATCGTARDNTLAVRLRPSNRGHYGQKKTAVRVGGSIAKLQGRGAVNMRCVDHIYT